MEFKKLPVNEEFGILANAERVDKVMKALKEHGFEVQTVTDAVAAQKVVLSLIPEGSEVMTMVSQTLDQSGIAAAINESGKYQSVRNKLTSMGQGAITKEKKNLGFSPAYALGSVHAITEQGEVLVASRSGSQLPAYIIGAETVILVVSTTKLVKDLNDGLKRINEYSYPLEDERAFKAYGVNSGVYDILIEQQSVPGRTKIILVGEKLGF